MGLNAKRAPALAMGARAVTDHSKQKQYEYLSAHYSYLAASFREALAMHSAALAKLTLH